MADNNDDIWSRNSKPRHALHWSGKFFAGEEAYVTPLVAAGGRFDRTLRNLYTAPVFSVPVGKTPS